MYCKKSFLFLCIGCCLSLGIPSYVVAAPSKKTISTTAEKKEQVPAGVIAVPDRAVAGESVVISAAVHNTTSQTVSVTVEFTAGTVLLGKKTIRIPKKEVGVATIEWSVPTVATTVTAEVPTAVGANGMFISTLVGTLGTVTITPATVLPKEVSALERIPGVVAVIAWGNRSIATIEPFRTKQAELFAQKASEARKSLGIAVGSAVGNAVEKKVSSALDPQPTETDTTSKKAYQSVAAVKEEGLHPLTYASLIGSVALGSFFGNKILFYVSLILLLLLLLRFIISFFKRD